MCISAKYLTIFIPQTLPDLGSHEILFGGGLRTSFTLRNFALIAILVFTVRLLFGKSTLLTVPHKIAYAGISIISLLIVHCMTLTTIRVDKQFQSEVITTSLVFVNLFIVALLLALLIYIFMLGQSTEENARLIEQQKIHELEALEYQNLIKSTEALREMKHDIQIHLDVIQDLAANGNTEDLLAYVQKYHTALDHTHHFLSTGNAAIDCIVSSKMEMAQKQGIETNCSVLIPKNFSMNPLSLSSMLGNLWSNSLEACQKLTNTMPEFHPHITFSIRPCKDMLLFHIENDYDGHTNQTVDGSYLSTKEEKDHGIGLKRIADIVKENGGIMQISSENRSFRVQIMIPITTKGIVK